MSILNRIVINSKAYSPLSTAETSQRCP
jgi:hypothetical protein